MRARSDLVKSIDPVATTFLVTYKIEQFRLFAGTVDILGLDKYPCSITHGCDFSKIDAEAAEADRLGVRYWGVVPAHGDSWYKVPTADEPIRSSSTGVRRTWRAISSSRGAFRTTCRRTGSRTTLSCRLSSPSRTPADRVRCQDSVRGFLLGFDHRSRQRLGASMAQDVPRSSRVRPKINNRCFPKLRWS